MPPEPARGRVVVTADGPVLVPGPVEEEPAGRMLPEPRGGGAGGRQVERGDDERQLQRQFEEVPAGQDHLHP